MAKENRLLLILVLSLLILPGTGLGNPAIKTAQRSIAIDPGHGGAERGLTSSGGLEEKTIVLKLAKKTAQKLETRYNVLLTRTADINVPVRERIFMANQNQADLFLSIHCHVSTPPSGWFFYFSPPAPDTQATRDAGNLWKSQPLLHQSESRQAAVSFVNVFSKHMGTGHFFLKSAPIIILEGAAMPAILIEPVSISNLPLDEIDALLEEYARLISKSIDLYFKKN